jgi:hypothetical protein
MIDLVSGKHNIKWPVQAGAEAAEQFHFSTVEL